MTGTQARSWLGSKAASILPNAQCELPGLHHNASLYPKNLVRSSYKKQRVEPVFETLAPYFSQNKSKTLNLALKTLDNSSLLHTINIYFKGRITKRERQRNLLSAVHSPNGHKDQRRPSQSKELHGVSHIGCRSPNT